MRNLDAKLNPLLFVLACGLGAWLLLTAAYSLKGDFRLGVGEFGDSPYLSGFNGDEAGTPRTRWTGGTRLDQAKTAVGVITIPWSLNPKADNKLRLDIRGLRDQPPPTVTVSLNGAVVGQTRPDPGTFKTVEFVIPAGVSGGDTTQIEISSPAVKPTGDNRYLGVQVSEVKLLSGPGFRRPPFDAFGWGWLYAVLVGLLLLRLAGPTYLLWSAGAGVATLIPWLLLPLLVPSGLNLWYMPFLLPGLSLLAGLAGLIVYRRWLENALTTFLERLDASPTLARNVLLIVLAVYTLYGLNIILKMDFIGHADYADNAVAARNIIQGRGYSLDYAAQFYYRYTLPRPADTWPPLQPFLIVPFYAVFGPTVWAAKLPNLLLMPLLAWVIFRYGSRLFSRRTGFLAAFLTLFAVVPAFSAAPAFFETIAYPINDLAFTLFTFLVIAEVALWVLDFKAKHDRKSKATLEQLELDLDQSDIFLDNPKRKRPDFWSSIQKRFLATKTSEIQSQSAINNLQSTILIGLWSGLLFLAKPSGAIFLVAVALWLLAQKYLGRFRLALRWRDFLVIAGVTLLVALPFLMRNQLQFGTPYRSTEQYDTWVTKWHPPDERIYDLYTPQTLPAARQLLEFGWDNDLNMINNQFKKFSGHLFDGQLFAPLIMLLAGLGLLVLPRHLYWLAALLGLAAVLYCLFINIYWHYEARYFLAWLPPLYLLGVYGLNWLYERVKASRPGPAVWLLVLLVGGLSIPTALDLVQNEGPGYTTPTGIVTTANWLKVNTPADARVMSRNIWELSFHSQRDGVMIPNNASLDQIKGVMREYNVTYLQLDHLNARSINEIWGQRPELDPLLDETPEYKGFKLVYDMTGQLVYQWNGR